ncbi:Uncharacterised protein [Mycobacteroides abscessus subsp. abscessus]|nr:Uncharacterised protein [Mycobacteroides abscessus subsp. abscessus]
MASIMPSGKADSRTSQLSSRPPRTSVTWASSSTCGPCEMIHTGSPKVSVTLSANSSPRLSALV